MGRVGEREPRSDDRRGEARARRVGLRSYARHRRRLPCCVVRVPWVRPLRVRALDRRRVGARRTPSRARATAGAARALRGGRVPDRRGDRRSHVVHRQVRLRLVPRRARRRGHDAPPHRRPPRAQGPRPRPGRVHGDRLHAGARRQARLALLADPRARCGRRRVASRVPRHRRRPRRGRRGAALDGRGAASVGRPLRATRHAPLRARSGRPLRRQRQGRLGPVRRHVRRARRRARLRRVPRRGRARDVARARGVAGAVARMVARRGPGAAPRCVPRRSSGAPVRPAGPPGRARRHRRAPLRGGSGGGHGSDPRPSPATDRDPPRRGLRVELRRHERVRKAREAGDRRTATGSAAGPLAPARPSRNRPGELDE